MPSKKVKKTVAKKAVIKKTTKKTIAKKETVKKKTIVKKAVKKTKAVTKKTSKKCVCVKRCLPEEAFWVNDGPIIMTLADLKKAVNSITEDQFNYHTSRDGNDFSKWIRDCLFDTVRARRVEKAKTRVGVIRALTAGCCK